MISLSYIAAYDPYHTMFRMLVLLPTGIDVPIDSARILDFYLCYPWLLADFRPARDVEGQVKALNAVKRAYHASPYQLTPPSSVLFNRMRPSQLAALNSLAANSYINAEAFKRGDVIRTDKPLPEKLSEMVQNKREADQGLLLLLHSMAHVPLGGRDGLKARTGLQEHRYDNA